MHLRLLINLVIFGLFRIETEYKVQNITRSVIVQIAIRNQHLINQQNN